MDDLLDAKLDKKFNDNQKQSCIYICNKLTEWFAKNAVTVNVNNWVNDYSKGYDTAKYDIQDFAKKHYEKFNDRTQWDAGYRHAMIDVMEYIERM